MTAGDRKCVRCGMTAREIAAERRALRERRYTPRIAGMPWVPCISVLGDYKAHKFGEDKQ